MCLGVPGKIIKKWQDQSTGLLMATVDFDGLKKDICIDYTPDSQVGEYVLVHVGFALSKIKTNKCEV